MNNLDNDAIEKGGNWNNDTIKKWRGDLLPALLSGFVYRREGGELNGHRIMQIRFR